MKRVLLTLVILSATLVKLSAQTKKNAPVSALVMTNGKKVYNQYCLSCHMADGGGVQNMNPPLSKTSYVTGDKTRLIKVILNGFSESVEIDGETYTNVMAPHNFLKDQEIADVLSYIRNSFGNKSGGVSALEVKNVRARNKK
ncbi:c-type cytochrome [Pedobacter nutrimenti]|jgi:mono/diheme cytochrome c family protein|uniref:Mono/diheme cytochrome c family protein n=1 Tax=Pedobacter nutrimenti TaxID=1241337 RepID=A0A318UHS7_9SPHI|nr:cytochrome c [Pedobacter nutrimenti]PYF72644.1 mono/diheme cytochrome c family protein [Pedobacter nutrimenti]